MTALSPGADTTDKEWCDEYGMCGGCGWDKEKCCMGCLEDTCVWCPVRRAEGHRFSRGRARVRYWKEDSLYVRGSWMEDFSGARAEWAIYYGGVTVCVALSPGDLGANWAFDAYEDIRTMIRRENINFTPITSADADFDWDSLIEDLLSRDKGENVMLLHLNDLVESIRVESILTNYFNLVDPS